MKKILRITNIVLSTAMLVLGIYGIYGFITVPPKAKQAQEEVRKLLELRQQLAEARKDEVLTWDYPVKPLYSYEDASEMKVTIIGDSVTLAAIDALYDVFPNGYVDAVFGRTIYDGQWALEELEEENSLGEVLVFSLGTNCETYEEDYEDLIEHSGKKPVFFITTYGVANSSNEVMTRVANRHTNVFVIDWETPALENRGDWILGDGLHPNNEGSYAYAELIRSHINRYVILLQREAHSHLVP